MAVWAAYREKHGPLNVGIRLEYLFAMSDYRRHKSHGGEATFEQFIRFQDAPHGEEAVPDLMAVAKSFGRPVLVRANNKHEGK